jgi:glycosidase
MRNLSRACITAALAALALSPIAGQAAKTEAGPRAGTSLDQPLYQPRDLVTLKNPDWSKTAVLYQLNVRHFTKEGSFKAAQKQLPRIKAMGADVIWLMPIHPIGKKNRKGTLGSPYSVQDYFGVNPEFGTEADLRAFITEAHRLNMKVILDWVANHTAWDNKLAIDHPDWYEKDWKGDFHPTPWQDWSDIIDLDYSKPGVRHHMTEALLYWVREFDVDGYRADVAGYIPQDFWETARVEMEKIKPVFLLAEWQSRELHHKAFDASYAWDWYNTLHDIAQGKGDATALYGYYGSHESSWPRESMRLQFIENHDKNAWEATQYEAFGPMLNAAIMFSLISDGIPMIHNGQEAGNAKRLAFFEKDEIVWKKHPIADLYRSGIAFKRANPALWNGRWGAKMEKVENSAPKQIFSFIRRANGTDRKPLPAGNQVFAAFNFSGQTATVKFPESLVAGTWMDIDKKAAVIDPETSVTIPAYGYKIMAR